MRTSSAFLRALGLAALFAAGCATAAPPAPAHPGEQDDHEQVQISVHMGRSVRIVGRVPASDHYAFVGRIRAVAPSQDFVRAAREVDEKLRQEAQALGADVVKIDVAQTDARRHQVLLAGRAYRRLD